MAGSTKVTVPALKWATENYKLTFHLIEVLSDYPSLRKGIWPGVGERVSGTSKIKCCQDIAKRLLLEHEVYGPDVQNKGEGLQAYGQSVKHQVQKMETTWKAAYKMLQVTGAGLDHEDEIWPTPEGDKLRDVWQEVKKKCPYFYELKPFVKERLTATDEAIGNSTDPIDISGILKDRQGKKDDGNQEPSSEKGEEKFPEAPDNPTIISDEEENTNILDPKLKKFTSSSQARYDPIYLINIKY